MDLIVFCIFARKMQNLHSHLPVFPSVSIIPRSKPVPRGSDSLRYR